MRLRMLKLRIGKGRQVIKQLYRRVLRYNASATILRLQSARGMCSTELELLAYSIHSKVLVLVAGEKKSSN